jgi:acetyl esterase/lipase
MEYIPDIEYINRDGISLYIQLILPYDRTENTPLVIYVPGSAFRWQNVKRVIPAISLLANRGFAIAMVQYRGSEVSPFPAQMLDTKAAVRFMKINAHKYGLNPDNVYLMGDSSGGHTVLMAGLTAGIEKFEEEIYSEVSSSVKGIIDLYGPTDITKMNDELSSLSHIEPDSPEGCLLGRVNVLEHPELTGPTVVMNYIDSAREIPPILIFHGTNDELVPFGQSCMLYDKLVKCNKKATFYAIDNAHHGGREFWSNQVLDIIEEFIKKI